MSKNCLNTCYTTYPRHEAPYSSIHVGISTTTLPVDKRYYSDLHSVGNQRSTRITLKYTKIEEINKLITNSEDFKEGYRISTYKTVSSSLWILGANMGIVNHWSQRVVAVSPRHQISRDVLQSVGNLGVVWL